MEQNSLISFIYFNNLLTFYLTMTRVGKHDKMLRTTSRKHTTYDTHNTTSRHTDHIMHTYTTLWTHTHIPHYAHITGILNHLDVQNFNTH